MHLECQGGDETQNQQIADFLTGLDADEPAQPNFRTALATQRVCDAVLASAKDGKWVDVVKD